ncbi:Thioredoxin-like 2, chloroplastic [Porphyridium purpureum]|uniref:Thioredoxin-like 2, chloroplastic n=1 Tax=Porphyridium purpureum TaxID=35688 RepID=A0A5J4YM17_PORPP|nr:Thioredoxin-like 2, chloroplastic [Porphyridium purpureum]|eukprot:POR9724..scf291_13
MWTPCAAFLLPAGVRGGSDVPRLRRGCGRGIGPIGQLEAVVGARARVRVQNVAVAEAERGVSEGESQRVTPQDILSRRNEQAVVVPVAGPAEFLAAMECSAKQLVVVKFYAPWCKSCAEIEPKFRRYAHEYPEFLFCEVDLQENKDMCRRVGVSALPFFQFYDGGAGKCESFSAGPKRFNDLVVAKLQEYSTGKCDLANHPEEAPVSSH